MVPLVLLCGAVATTAADYYQLPNIKRIDPDLYRAGKVVIVTSSCLHLTGGEEALLKYDGPGEYEITIDPTGRYFFAANQFSNNVVIFTVDAQSGQLAPTGQQLHMDQPASVFLVKSGISNETVQRK